MAQVAIIGAGAMGLAAAYHAAKAGHRVTVYEADRIPGGMAAHFDFGGLSIERYYHFVCKADQPTFDLMRELGLSDRNALGRHLDGLFHRWPAFHMGRSPLAARIPQARSHLQASLRTADVHLDQAADWRPLETMRAKDWIIGWAGQKAYDVLWNRLFELKFFEYADDISAAWIWTRIKRIGTSRRSLLQEELGYIDGGSETLVSALVAAIGRLGGEIRLGTPVTRIADAGGASAASNSTASCCRSMR